MSRESYARGFVKCAIANGVDPGWLLKEAESAQDRKLRMDIDRDVDSRQDGKSKGGNPAVDGIPAMPVLPKKPYLIQNPGAAGVEANKRAEKKYKEDLAKYHAAFRARLDAIKKRRQAILDNARGDVPSYDDFVAWTSFGVPNLAREISRGTVPNVKYDFVSGTNALTNVRRQIWGSQADSFPSVMETLKNLHPSYRGNTELMRHTPQSVMGNPLLDVVLGTKEETGSR